MVYNTRVVTALKDFIGLEIKEKKITLPINYNNLNFIEKRKVREEYIKRQNNLCYYCKQPLENIPTMLKEINRSIFPKNFFNHPVHLHHNHNTGMTIGAVHCYCNAVLWEYKGE